MGLPNSIIRSDELILVTGATGFIGLRVLESLLEHGFRRVRCLTRASSNLQALTTLIDRHSNSAHIEIVSGNLLSRQDCLNAAQDAAAVCHLAAGTGQKSIPHAFLNTVVATRNLLDALTQLRCVKRFVNLSSFTVYTNRNKPLGRVLDESCPTEDRPDRRCDAYAYAKIKQDELVIQYGREHRMPYVLLRPGAVYGPGKKGLTGRVGIDTLASSFISAEPNIIPLTYVANCADAVVLAVSTPGIEGEVFNIVDDDLPSSRTLLRLYKQNVGHFRSLYVPGFCSRLMCGLWERYSQWSNGQLPPAFNRWRWHVEWKKSSYSNHKLKNRLGWSPRVPTQQGLANYFAACSQGGARA